MTIEASGPQAQAHRRIRLGMVGGGEGAFIGAVHRIAARLDDHYELVAGALSSTPEKALRSAAALGLARGYADYRTMAREEAARDDGIEAVAIVTPNHQHAPAAQAFLEAGIHVICDKPVTTTLADAERLRALAISRGRLFAVTYNYSGYPMVRHAAELVQSGMLGQVRKVYAEYHQGWLATDLEKTGQKQASWRQDPARAGMGGSLGDIGTHAEQLIRFVTGLRVESVHAELTSFVPGRVLDDDAAVLLRLSGGAKATLTCSQVCVGEANGLSLRVYGETGGLIWRQERPEELTVTKLDGTRTVLSRGSGGLSERAGVATRLPGGHPEGFIEAFGNLYRGVAQAIIAKRDGIEPGALASEVPGAEDGRLGVRFVEACVDSARAGAWARV